MLHRLMKPTLIILVALFAATTHADLIVYDNSGLQYFVENALTYMGYSYTVSSSISAADLSAGDVLLIPWNYSGDMSGLAGDVWGAVTGNVWLSGQDVDTHAYNGYDMGGDPASIIAGYAQTLLSQAIEFAGAGGGVGLVALGDYSTAFSYLPSAWGISATGGLARESIWSFTAEGVASGVYDGLTPGDLSDWGQSYHATFDAWGAGFSAFQLGNGGLDTVAIGHVVPVPGAVLLGMLGLSYAGMKLRRTK